MISKTLTSTLLAATTSAIAIGTETNLEQQMIQKPVVYPHDSYLGCWKAENHWYYKSPIYLYGDGTYWNTFYNWYELWTYKDGVITLDSYDGWGDWVL